MKRTPSHSFTFGIYPGGMSGTDKGLTTGPADSAQAIENALRILQGDVPSFLVRAYIPYKSGRAAVHPTPVQPSQYAKENRLLDLVLCFQSDEEDMSTWKAFIRDTIRKYGARLAKLQVTEEANANLPSLDGFYKHSRKALVEGIVAAKEEIQTLGLQTIVGFNATPDFNPEKKFWLEIASLATPAFYDALDYVGLDFFPDVFRPIAGEDLEGPITGLIAMFRADIGQAGIRSTIPLHITENGWPTHHDRTEQRQAAQLEKIIRIVHRHRETFHITHYELFALRDADSNVQDLFYQFGILRDDYSPKLAFEMYRKIVAELTIA
ncbi:hypothetical protein [Chryseolinea soli]|uniref:Uncharacterized protein n=1 Tax=Chryseolinea soli TaxID=2321403 RepID=A0A385SRY4_9BACT|nr:hypothetical protein [Chryseolinea soli]AYB33949.1 hypothetical protein D4L85_26715 [Chryseolinea soli]